MNKPSLLIATSLAAAAAFAAPLAAQIVEKGPAVAVATSAQAQKARIVLDSGARCLLSEKPGNVRNFLRLFPGSKDAARTAAYLNKGECIDGAAGPISMQFSAMALRGAFYKALYSSDYGDGAPALGDVSLDVRGDVEGQDPAAAKDYVSARHFAECVVRKDAVGVRAVVLAETESTAEREALGRLQPQFATCVDRDMPELTRGMVTGVLAEALYRMTGPKSASKG